MSTRSSARGGGPAGLGAAWWLTLGGVLLTAGAALAAWLGASPWWPLLAAPAPLAGLLWLAVNRRQHQALSAAWQDLQRRQAEWEQRLLRYQEWLEFPLDEEPAAPAPQAWDARRRAAQADVRLETLLQEATESIYEKIRTNQYAPFGLVDGGLIRRDAWELAEQVARLYHPELPAPLMQASPEQLLRAVQRVALQLLAMLEELPLDVKGRTAEELYAYLRRAVNAYGVYRSAQPYLPWVSRAVYLGRFALGANPWTLGAWYVLGKLGAHGAQAAATRLFHRQALLWMHQAVRVVGVEAACIYGGDYRHRDPHWIFAVEVADLTRRLPAGDGNLEYALRTITSAPLRSEYDRLFLYRCLAARKSPRPERFEAQEFLTPKQRHVLAQRLNAYCRRLPNAAPKPLAQWRAAATERLDVRFDGVQDGVDAPPAEAAAATLAGFLLDVKGCEPEQLPGVLAGAATWTQLPAEQRDRLQQHWNESPPYLLEFPALDPASPEAERLLEDLAALTAAVPPWDPSMEEAAVSLAAYLQRDPDEFAERIERQVLRAFTDRLQAAPPRTLTAEVALAMLNLLDRDERPLAVLHPISVAGVESEWLGRTDGRRTLWLLHRESGLLLLAMDEAPRVLWTAERGEAVAEAESGWLGGSCRIRGGRWLPPYSEWNAGDVRLVLQRGLLQSSRSWESLLQRFGPGAEPL